jgi:hypothetical protein
MIIKNFSFNHLNLVIGHFRPTGNERIVAMVVITIGKNSQHFSKGDYQFQMYLLRHCTSLFKFFLNLIKILLYPKLLKKIFEDVNIGKVMIHFQQSMEPWYFFGKKVFLVLQEQIFAFCERIYPYLGKFPKFLLSSHELMIITKAFTSQNRLKVINAV